MTTTAKGILARRTWRKEFKRETPNGRAYTETIVVTTELEDLGEGPMFNIGTTEYDSRHRPASEPVAGGSLDAETARLFPQLRAFVPFSGWHLDRGPWYYVDNTMFWLGYTRDGYPSRDIYGKPHKDTPNYEHARSCCGFGLLASDDGADLEHMTGGEALDFLEARWPALMEAFKSAMCELFDKPEELEVIAKYCATAPHTYTRPRAFVAALKAGDLAAADLLTAKRDEIDEVYKANFNIIDVPKDLADAYARAELQWADRVLRDAACYLRRQTYA